MRTSSIDQTRTVGQPQQCCIPKPMIARNALPWAPSEHNPNGVVATVTRVPNENGMAATALRLMICWTMTQGRRCRANLGLEVTIPLGLADAMPDAQNNPTAVCSTPPSAPPNGLGGIRGGRGRRLRGRGGSVRCSDRSSTCGGRAWALSPTPAGNVRSIVRAALRIEPGA